MIFRFYKPPDPAGKPTFPLSTLPGKELILLNEFKWDERIISWEGFKERTSCVSCDGRQVVLRCVQML